MALKRVKYTWKGGPPKLDIAGLGVVKYGETMELPAEMAERLVEQRPDHFALDGGGSKTAKAKAKTGPGEEAPHD